MKFCPTCETRYDEDILRFCMKDGTPLVDEDEPKFIQMPSEDIEPVSADDDEGEATIVRRFKVPPQNSTIDDIEFEPKEEPPPRIVVPMSQPEPPRTRVIAAQQPKKPNTILIVLLTMFGTAALLVLGAGILWFFIGRGNNAANSNANSNTNVNTNINSNVGVSNAFDFGNTTPGSNINTNASTKTPTPTATPTPRPSATPTPDETPEPDDSPKPSRTPAPARTPAPLPTPIIIRPDQPSTRATPARPIRTPSN